MMNALRLTDGFALSLFEERAGVPLVTALDALNEAERRGLIERDHERVRPSPLGRRFLNDLLQIFLPADGEVARRHAPVATMSATPHVQKPAASST